QNKTKKETDGIFFFLGPRRDRAVQLALFEHRQNEFLGCAGIRGGLEDDELSLLQMRADGFRRFFDVAEVWLAIFVQGSRNADEDLVHFLELRKVIGSRKMAAIAALLNFGDV